MFVQPGAKATRERPMGTDGSRWSDAYIPSTPFEKKLR